MLSIVYPPSRIKCVTEDFVSTILCPRRTYQLRSFHSDEFIVSWRMQGNLVNHNSPLDGNIDNNFGVIIRKVQRTEIGLNFNSTRRRERNCYRNPKRDLRSGLSRESSPPSQNLTAHLTTKASVLPLTFPGFELRCPKSCLMGFRLKFYTSLIIREPSESSP